MKYITFFLISVLLLGCNTININFRHSNNSDFKSRYNELEIYFKESDFRDREVINPLYLGEKSSDDTELLQKTLNSGFNIVVIPKTSEPWITEPLYIPSDITVIFEKGSIIQAKKGAFKDLNDSLINIFDSENVRLYGYNSTLKMWRKDYDSPEYKPGQWRHSISIRSSENIIIEGFKLDESGGDGVYLGQSTSDETNYNVILRDLYIANQYRQGISVTSANGLLVDNVFVKGTKGHLPEAGIDFEPNSDSKELTGIVMNKCNFIKNNGAGFLVSLQNYNKKSVPVDIKVSDSIFHGKFLGLSIMNTGNDPYGRIVFNNTEFKGLDLNLKGKNLEVEFNK